VNEGRDDLQEIIDKALEEMAAEAGEGFEPQACNLADFCRRTGLTRSRARTIKNHGFRVLPHGNSGRKAKTTVLTGHTGLVDDLLRKGVTNSQVIYERLVGQGYRGGLTSVKAYVAAHMDLVPARRRTVAPQGSRGQRLGTGPGEAYQMDWGFVTVVGPAGAEGRIACFAMVCHHCGSSYVEFFPNARQENLLIGMVHAFMAMGVPDEVPADNMKSVVVRRDLDGRPVWQRDYAEFMGCVGFRTRLCKPRRPFTKGKVERLIRFVKDNFLAGRDLADITALNEGAALWCAEQAGRWRRAVARVPAEGHEAACRAAARELVVTEEVALWLCPRRRITFDGFAGYEGRRFGVPWWYERRDCRVSREGRCLHIYSDDLSRELVAHAVTWDRRDSWCEGQWADAQPEELPSQPVTTSIAQVELSTGKPAFAKFDFGRWA
jgi:transposase